MCFGHFCLIFCEVSIQFLKIRLFILFLLILGAPYVFYTLNISQFICGKHLQFVVTLFTLLLFDNNFYYLRNPEIIHSPVYSKILPSLFKFLIHLELHFVYDMRGGDSI